MAYSLNTDASTSKITLCSSGTYTGHIYRPSFNLSKALKLDERLLHLCGVEIVILKHPTFFHDQYMDGEVVLQLFKQLGVLQKPKDSTVRTSTIF